MHAGAPAVARNVRWIERRRQRHQGQHVGQAQIGIHPAGDQRPPLFDLRQQAHALHLLPYGAQHVHLAAAPVNLGRRLAAAHVPQRHVGIEAVTANAQRVLLPAFLQARVERRVFEPPVGQRAVHADHQPAQPLDDLLEAGEIDPRVMV